MCILKAYFSKTFIYRIIEVQVPWDFNFQLPEIQGKWYQT